MNHGHKKSADALVLRLNSLNRLDVWFPLVLEELGDREPALEKACAEAEAAHAECLANLAADMTAVGRRHEVKGGGGVGGAGQVGWEMD